MQEKQCNIMMHCTPNIMAMPLMWLFDLIAWCSRSAIFLFRDWLLHWLAKGGELSMYKSVWVLAFLAWYAHSIAVLQTALLISNRRGFTHKQATEKPCRDEDGMLNSELTKMMMLDNLGRYYAVFTLQLCYTLAVITLCVLNLYFITV